MRLAEKAFKNETRRLDIHRLNSRSLKLDNRSLLLTTTFVRLVLLFARDDLSQHDHTITVHECNTRQALAILERIAHERLLRLEVAFSHLVRLQRMRIFHLLTSSLLPHLPFELGDTASRTTATAH